VGLGVQAFVQVQMARHSPDTARSFGALIALAPEVISAWTLTGEADYLLRVWCADLAALNRLIHQTLLPHPAVARVQSQIVMDQLKADAPLPT
jgi:DNA-binding Lrp family transcriptional regulator